MTEETAVPVRPTRDRRQVWLTVAVTQLVLAVLTVGAVTLAYNTLNGNIEEGETINHQATKQRVAAADAGPMEPLNILILGSDSRAGDGNDIDGLGDIGERADTTILMHVSADRRNAYGVSLPRDAIVDRPDCMDADGEMAAGEAQVMFNTAFSVGGAQCAVQTVESLTGIYIDHFLVVDFNGFKDMVEAINGVEVCLPKEVNDPEHDIFLPAGVQTLTGQDALNYVRERSILSATGDIGRMKRQQAFIASMINKVKSAGILSQPLSIFNFLNAATSSIEVDADLDSVGKLADLATQFRNTGLSDISFITVPIAEYPLDPNRLIWTEQADELWARIMDDQQLGKDFSATSIGADDSVGSIDEPTETPTDEPSDEPTGEPTDAPTTDEPTLDPDDQAAAEARDQARLAAGLCT
ncbi:MAG: LCP family protein [Nocardioides sp.]|uniref:LCP family protein n=1 Tax=Nocardioides sp. TaxID=35761 RepID=UPI00239A142A|nr:LCP family protein [Nocardioides sp.]MDE0774905.1 LCP family protein [Nocardioides sp.]